MPQANQYQSEQRIFAMFVGRSGDGKSIAAASFAAAAVTSGKKFLDLDFDYRFGGIASGIKQKICKLDELEKLVEYQQFSPREGWASVDKKLMELENARVVGNFQYGAICTDSLTSLTRLFIVASHSSQNGKKIGTLRVSGPGDFNFEASATHQYFDFMRTFPCHIICSAHIVDKWGKDPGNEFGGNVVIGEKLSVRDNLGENVQTYFDNVFRFSREVVNGKTMFYVEFATDLAKNSFGIPPGKHDITGKNFYVYLQELIAKYRS